MLAKLVIQQPGNHILVKKCRIWFLKIQKEVKCTQKKIAALKILGEKSCEIKGGSQEMAAVMLMLKIFNNVQQRAALFFYSFAVFEWIFYTPVDEAIIVLE